MGQQAASNREDVCSFKSYGNLIERLEELKSVRMYYK